MDRCMLLLQTRQKPFPKKKEQDKKSLTKSTGVRLVYLWIQNTVGDLLQRKNNRIKGNRDANFQQRISNGKTEVQLYYMPIISTCIQGDKFRFWYMKIISTLLYR